MWFRAEGKQRVKILHMCYRFHPISVSLSSPFLIYLSFLYIQYENGEFERCIILVQASIKKEQIKLKMMVAEDMNLLTVGDYGSRS